MKLILLFFTGFGSFCNTRLRVFARHPAPDCQDDTRRLTIIAPFGWFRQSGPVAGPAGGLVGSAGPTIDFLWIFLRPSAKMNHAREELE
jgi:hypothetical protein